MPEDLAASAFKQVYMPTAAATAAHAGAEVALDSTITIGAQIVGQIGAKLAQHSVWQNLHATRLSSEQIAFGLRLIQAILAGALDSIGAEIATTLFAASLRTEAR